MHAHIRMQCARPPATQPRQNKEVGCFRDVAALIHLPCYPSLDPDAPDKAWLCRHKHTRACEQRNRMCTVTHTYARGHRGTQHKHTLRRGIVSLPFFISQPRYCDSSTPESDAPAIAWVCRHTHTGNALREIKYAHSHTHACAH